MQGPRVHYSLSAFGLDVRADFPLPGADFAPAKRQAFAELRELSVQNLALIEDVHVELQGGYSAWTGET